MPTVRRFLAPFALLVACQGGGALLAPRLPLPVSGPVVGLLLAVAFLLPRGDALGALPDVAASLHRHLPLFFVPAGTGVMLWLPTLGREWGPIAMAIVASTLVGLVVTALVMRRLDAAEAPDAGDAAPAHDAVHDAMPASGA